MSLMNRVERAAFAAAAVVFVLLVGCQKRGNEYVPPPPPEVTVAKPVLRTVTRYLEYTGTTMGIESVQVRARVKGFLEKLHFTPGNPVDEGTLLFTIDQRTFRVEVQAAEAELAGKKAAASILEIQYRKVIELQSKGAATPLEVDEWKAKRDQAVAAVEYAQAQLDTAKLNLGFTEVRSPIKGIVGLNLVDVGTLVGASEPTLLTTVIRRDQVYAYFDVSERDVLDIVAERIARGQSARMSAPVQLEMGMANETGFPHSGFVDFRDNTVNAQTGTMRVRGVFGNLNSEIMPGVFVRVRAPRNAAKLLMLPDAAVQQDQAGRYVLVVNDKNEVERRAVTVSKAIGQVRPIESGVSANDSVIINGLLRARPGGKVVPKQGAVDPAILPPEPDLKQETLIPGMTETAPSATTQPSTSPAKPAAQATGK